MQTLYPALIQPVKGGYLVQFVDLEEAFTEGDTLDEALANAREALTLTVEGRLEEGLPIPVPSQGIPRARYIAPSANAQAALSAYWLRGGRLTMEEARKVAHPV